MIPSVDDCDDCVPAYAKQSLSLAAALSTLPFVFTFLAATTVILTKVYPLLSKPFPRDRPARHGSGSRSRGGDAILANAPRGITKNLAAVTFSFTVALSVVLVELLLCEISNFFNAAARGVALQFAVISLLFSLVVVIPLIEIHSVLAKSGWEFTGTRKGVKWIAWLLEIVGYAIFLVCFWAVGQLLPHKSGTDTVAGVFGRHNLVQAGLERLGVAGISSMGLLSGFASVSSIWHNLVSRPKPVSNADIERKRAGLEATTEMLAEKKERIRQIEAKLSSAQTPGFWSRAVGSLRGSAETREKQTLEMEVSGLDTMANSLETTLSMLESRRNSQIYSHTARGRLTLVFSYSFSFYCMYRIGTTTVNIVRRLLSQGAQVGDADPVTNAIALFARHVYPSLDQASWARQISFLLSGIMLLASFSAVMQTFHLFARFAPSVLHATKSNFALIIAQISGTYVISSALMLRGMMPTEFRRIISSALDVDLLDPVWASKWFDGFFIVAVLLTAQGLWVSRKLSGSSVWDDDSWDGDMEMGKQL